MAISRILGCVAAPCAGGRGATVPTAPSAVNCSAEAIEPNLECQGVGAEEESLEVHEGAAPQRPMGLPGLLLPTSMAPSRPLPTAASKVQALANPTESALISSTPRPTRRTQRTSSLESLAKVASKARSVLKRMTSRGASPRAASVECNAEPEVSADVQAILRLLEPGQPLAGLSAFAKEYGDAAFCRRLLRKYEGDVRKASRTFEEALRWREQKQELITTRKFAPGGDNRVLGLDAQGRPILYMCLRNQMLPGTQCVDLMTVRTLQAIDLMPPGVERATHVWDLHGMMLRLNLSPTFLVQMIQSMEGYFAERVHKVAIIDMPGVARFLKDAVWPLLPAKSKDKIVFLSAKEAATYFQAECPREMADRLGAVMAQNRDAKSTLEERKRTWMRLDRSGQMVPAFA